MPALYAELVVRARNLMLGLVISLSHRKRQWLVGAALPSLCCCSPRRWPRSFLLLMPAFQVFSGTVSEQRDARGPHNLVFGADEEGDKLATLAPGVFAGGGAAPVMSSCGQFASLLLKALARIPAVGGPAAGKTLRSHRTSDQYLRRLWNTALAILARQSVEY